MTPASFPKARISSAATTFIFQKPRRIGFLALFLEALHHSRRIQAQRYLTTHRHLLADSRDSWQQVKTGGQNNVDR